LCGISPRGLVRPGYRKIEILDAERLVSRQERDAAAPTHAGDRP
jgi:hypothetical protein